jgi:hypothetical protein
MYLKMHSRTKRKSCSSLGNDISKEGLGNFMLFTNVFVVGINLRSSRT